MISPEFRNQFNQLAEQQAPDSAGKVSAEVARINAILQRPTGSVREAFAALNEIRLNLSRAPACQALTRSLRPLIREEMSRLSSIEEISQETLSPGVERKQVAEEALVESPEKKGGVEELESLPVIEACDWAYDSLKMDFIVEDHIESFYELATAQATVYLKGLVRQGILRGLSFTLDKSKDLLLKKLNQDKEKDLELIRTYVQEKNHSPVANALFDHSDLVEIPWQQAREAIKDQIAFFDYLEKRPVSHVYSKNQQLIFQKFCLAIQEFYNSLKSSNEKPSLLVWQDIKTFLFSCVYSSFSEHVPDYYRLRGFARTYWLSEPSHIETWQAIGKNVLSEILSELPQEPLHSTLLNFFKKMDVCLISLFSIAGLVPLLKISSAQNELQELLSEGISPELFHLLLSLFPLYREMGSFLPDVIAAHKLLKERGYDNETSSLILREALNSPENLGVLSKKIQHLSPESLRMLSEYKNNSYTKDFLLNGGSPYFLERLHAHGVKELDFVPMDTIQFFSEKKNIDPFFDRFGTLISSQNDLIFKLGPIKKLDFLMRVIDPYIGDKPIDHQREIVASAIRVYDAIKYDSWDEVEEDDIYAIASKLTPEEKQKILQRFPLGAISKQYLAEAFGMFESTIAKSPLDQVATEPLIRFLFTKTFQEAKTWLEQKLPDGTPRLRTLSLVQKERILCSFPRFESKLPIKPWEELLGVTEEQAKQIVEEATSEVSLQTPFSELKDIDSNDPLNALSQTMDKFDVEVAPAVVYMLLSARVSTRVCAGQPFLTWGSAEPASSLCVAADSAPLHTSMGSVYPRGAFNDFSCSFPAVTLRRKIIEHEKAEPGFIDSLVTALENEDPKASPDKEMYYEIRRIAQYFAKTHPTLSMDRDTDTVYNRFTASPPSTEVPPEVEMAPAAPLENVEMVPPEAQPSVTPEPMEEETPSPLLSTQGLKELEQRFLTSSAFKKDECFRTLLRDLFRIISKTPDLEQSIDLANQAHVHGVVFMALFLLARHAKLTSEPGKLDVAFSPFVRFLLKYVDPQPEVRLEDNPGIEAKDFWSFKSDYPFHSLSLLTPDLNFPPQTFLSFAESIKKLSWDEFYSLCAACLAPQLLSIDTDSAVDDPRASRFLEVIENADPTHVATKVLTETTRLWLNNLATNDVPAMPKKPIPLKAGNKIPFYRDGVADYTPLERIPKYLLSAGNYVSAALNKNMEPHNPRLHDGSCGINAFLLGFLGLELKDAEKVPLKILREKVQDFRKKIVTYAREHKAELQEKFPKEKVLYKGKVVEKDEVQKLIDGYENMDNPQWASSLVWECAANIYKRPIIVYGCPENPGDIFKIGENGEIEPTAIFQPKEPAEGPPIHLMWWESMHYCYLERK